MDTSGPPTLDSFVGLPWQDRGRTRDGCDCWGLLRLVYAELLRIELPSYSGTYATAADREATTALLAVDRSDWAEVPAGQECPLDGVLMRGHVGIVQKPGLMLHMPEGGTAQIAQYRKPMFASRVQGFFRHRSAPWAS